MKQIITLFFICAALYSHAGSTPRYEIVESTNSSPNCIVIQKDTVWIGTSYGIEKRLKNGKLLSLFEQNYVYNLFLDASGTIWAGTSAGLYQIKDNILIKYSESNAFFSSSVRNIESDSQNNLWISTSIGVASIKNNVVTIYNEANGLPDENITSVFTEGSSIYFATSKGMIIRFNGQKYDTIQGSDQVKTKNISRLNKDSLLVSANTGLFIIYKDSLKSYNDTITPIKTIQLSDNKIIAMDNKILSCNNNTFIVQTTLSNSIDDIFAEKDTIWIITYYGIYKYSTGNLQHFARTSNEDFSSIATDKNNNLWIAQGSTLIKRDTAALLTIFDLPQTANYARINKIAVSTKNIIWIATQGNGIFKFENKTWTQYTTQNASSLPSDYIRDLLIDNKDSIWISTYYGVATRNGVWKNYTTDDGLICNNSYYLTQNASGSILVTSSFDTYEDCGQAGVSKFQNNKWQALVNAKDSIAIESAIYDNQNRLWLCDTLGVMMYDGKWHNYRSMVDNKLTYNALNSKNGFIWFSTYDGVYAIKDSTTYHVWKYYNTNGSINGDVYGFAEDSKANIWACSFRFIFKLNPPTANISYQPACVGKAVKLTGSSNSENAVYNWDINNDGVIDSTKQSIQFACKTAKDSVTLMVSNGFDSTIIGRKIAIHKPAIPQIGVTTVSDDNRSILVAWNRKKDLRIAKYNIYLNTVNGYKLIGIRPFDSIGVFKDTKSDFAHTSYTYKLTASDDCGVETPLDSSIAHTTVHVSNYKSVADNKCDLRWNKYVGAKIKGYYIYETTNGLVDKPIDTLPEENISVTISPIKPGFEYRVGVIMADTVKPKETKSDSGPFSQSMSNMSEANLVASTELTGVDVVAFPQVASSEITLLISAEQAATISYSIISMQANKVMQSNEFKGTSLDQKIQVEHLPNGMYELHVEINGIAKNFKFIKQ